MNEQEDSLGKLLQSMMPELQEELDEGTISTGKEIEQLKAEVEGLKATLDNVAEALDKTVSLYNHAKQEASLLRASHESAKAAAGDSTKKLAVDLMSMFSIDYNALVMNMIESKKISVDEITTRMKAHMEKTSEIDKFHKKIAQIVKSSIQINTEDLEIDYYELVECVDYDSIAYNVCYSSIAECLSFDPTDYWDASDLAQNFGEDDIAGHIDAGEVANNINIDDIVSEIDLDDIAKRVNTDDLANSIVDSIDMDELAQKVIDLRGEVQ